jgi:hypothetical protein
MDIHGTITSLENFNSLVNDIQFRRAPLGLQGYPMRWEFYRGQADASWHIVPGIARDLTIPVFILESELAIIGYFKLRIEQDGQLGSVFLQEHPSIWPATSLGREEALCQSSFFKYFAA